MTIANIGLSGSQILYELRSIITRSYRQYQLRAWRCPKCLFADRLSHRVCSSLRFAALQLTSRPRDESQRHSPTFTDITDVHREAVKYFVDNLGLATNGVKLNTLAGLLPSQYPPFARTPG